MKIKLLASVTFALIAFCSNVFSQAKPAATPTDTKPKTDLELFQEKYGAVIVKGYSELPVINGSGGSFQLTVMEFRNPGTGSKVKGLIAEVTPGERYATSSRSFVEYGEIDSLINGIGYISKIDKNVTTLQSFEARYTTKGDFEVTVFSRTNGGSGVALTAGRYSSKNVFLDQAALTTLVAQLQQAKTMLDAL
jgi:hypothetical protein